MEFSGIDATTATHAMELQREADRLTSFRMNHSEKLGMAIGLSQRGWLTFFGSCYMSYTDLQDGRKAKKAQKLLGVSTPLSNGHIEDPIADKRFRDALMHGMEVRADREGDIKTLALLGLKREVDRRRDARMQRNRELAQKYTDVSVGAIQTNRIKTALEMTGMLLHISPLANNRRIRGTALSMLAVSSGIGLVGERKYAKMVNESLVERAQACPNKLNITQLREQTPLHITDETCENPQLKAA